MSACPTCFMDLSVAGACFCEDAPKAKFTQVTSDFKLLVDESPAAPVQDGPMSSAEVVRATRQLLDQHDLHNIAISWMNSTNTFGQCRFLLNKAIEIRFSKKLFPHMSRTEQMNTITHEVAHALTPGHRHDHVWRAKHRELGGDARRCSDVDEKVMEATKKWKGTCPNGHVQFRSQKSAKMFQVSCGKCSRRWNPDFRYNWKAQW